MKTSIVFEDREYDASFIRSIYDSTFSSLSSEDRILVNASDKLAFVLSMYLGKTKGCGVVAVPSYWNDEQVDAILDLVHPNLIFESSSDQTEIHIKPGVEGTSKESISEVIIFTSGTTGTPKAVSHTWESISAAAGYVPERLKRRTWYMAYEPASYAGLQVLYSCLFNDGKLVFPSNSNAFENHPRLITDHGVEVISATPTWWRMLITSWPNERKPPKLRQVTMGGEVIDQSTIDRVDDFFNPDHFTHIFASSEAGTSIIVSDRKAGFPADLLDAEKKTRLRIKEGVLEIKSPFRMQKYLNGETGSENTEWITTGDRVKRVGDRYFFLGRDDRRLNIGGVKVSPEEIENKIRAYPSVTDCMVYGKSNPIVGMLIVAEVVPDKIDEFDVSGLKSFLLDHLPEYKTPRHYKVVDKIDITENGKKRRN